MPTSKDLYKKNGFLKSEPNISESYVFDVAGKNINEIINKLSFISSSLETKINLNYATSAVIVTGSYSEQLPIVEQSYNRKNLLFLNNTNALIGIYLSSSIEPSYFIGNGETYQANNTNIYLKHEFKYYPQQNPATSGFWSKTITE